MPERVIIIGAGGHGQVVADALWQMQKAGADVQPIGFLDDERSLTGSTLLNLTVFGLVEELSQVDFDTLVLAIGNNRIRFEKYIELRSQGICFTTVCHPQAIIAADVAIGCGSVIMAGAIVNTGSKIGENSIINTRCNIDHHNKIGAQVHVAPGVTLGGNVQVDDGAFVGIGSTVMPGRNIGAWSTVGAGALVQRDVVEGSTVIGVPARRFR